MKYRSGSSKIKEQHHMLDGLKEFLKQFESWDEVQSIIPARINRTRSSQAKIIFEYKLDTPAGVKCSVKSKLGVQEVFIVTNDREAVKKKLAALNSEPEQSTKNLQPAEQKSKKKIRKSKERK